MISIVNCGRVGKGPAALALTLGEMCKNDYFIFEKWLMRTVKVIGWVAGMKKVSFTKLQMKLAGLSLKESKLNTDRVLDGYSVMLYFEKDEDMLNFVRLSKDAGIILEVTE